MLITSDQIRAARALKNWSQGELARRAGLAVPTIANIELGKQKPSAETIKAIVQAFENGGIEFTSEEGVKKKTSNIQTYRGKAGFAEFFEDIDGTAESLPGGYFCISNMDERDFIKWEGQDIQDKHTERILNSNIRYKIIIREGDTYMPASPYAEYRWARKDQFYSVPLYIYGDKVGIIGFEDDDVHVFVIQHAYIADLCRRQFEEMWNRTLEISGQYDI